MDECNLGWCGLSEQGKRRYSRRATSKKLKELLREAKKGAKATHSMLQKIVKDRKRQERNQGLRRMKR